MNTDQEVSDLLARIEELEGEVAKHDARSREEETAAKVAEAIAPLEAQIEELQKALDIAKLEAEGAKREFEEYKGAIEAFAAEAAAAEAIASLRQERLAAVKEVAAFAEDYLEANADRWAAMDQEAFDALLTDYKAVSVKPESSSEDKEAKPETAFDHSRESDTKSDTGLFRDVIGAARKSGTRLSSISNK